jgi:hypothetical protein
MIIAATVTLYLHKDTTVVKGDDPHYVGSDSCKSCHQKKHTSWHHSMHPKIFKKYTNETQIVADFKNKPDFVTFDKKDIDVIIGGKWEQVFAREIDGEHYPFPAKWMHLTKEWVPYLTKTWQKTPLTQKCNGCHTTGLNKETGEFSEFGVSCESCHGAGSLHVQNKRMLKDSMCKNCHRSASLKEKLEKEVDILRSIKPAVCGQCHSRGVENKIDKYHTKVQFNFPVEYLPGQELSKNFKPTTPTTDKKGKNWWGNGVSKNRHQEYADFAKSDHSKSLKNLRTKRDTSCGKEPEDSCLKCHSADYILADDDKKPTLATAKNDITCVVCHNPHKVGNTKEKASEQCIKCHTKKTKTMKEHPVHYPCPKEEVTCADCHMPRIVKTGGKFSLRSHAFKIIPPEATEKYGMPSSCQNGSCHSDKTVEWAKKEYHKFYSDQNKTLRDVLRSMP